MATHGVVVEHTPEGTVHRCICGFETSPSRSHKEADDQIAAHIADVEPSAVEAPEDEEETSEVEAKPVKKSRKAKATEKVEADSAVDTSESDSESDEHDDDKSDEDGDHSSEDSE